jgi:hypothetical protein
MVLAEQEDIREQLIALREQLNTMKSYGSQISDLQAQVEVLKDSSEGYMRIRDRFLDVFLRDVENLPQFKWSKVIAEGNKAAHNGDAVADASLFESGYRNDEALMVRIYGLTYQQVLTLSKYSLPSSRYMCSYSICRTNQRLRQHLPP